MHCKECGAFLGQPTADLLREISQGFVCKKCGTHKYAWVTKETFIKYGLGSSEYLRII